MWVRVIAFIVVCQHLQVAFGNVDVDVTIDDLQHQVQELQSDVTDLSKMVENLEKNVVNRNIAEQKLDKAIASVLMNNQDKAAMYWRAMVTYLDSSLLNESLKSLIENSYLGSSQNFYFVLDFLLKNDLYMGFPMLLKELEEHGELQRGQEIFVLAHVVKSLCGISNEFYNKFPKVVREVMAGPVLLKNVDNMGYILANEGQVRVDLLPSTTTITDLKNTSRAQWQFSGPENFTELSEGFCIKNMANDFVFVFSQSPPQGFLKGNSSNMSYNSGPMHTQFLPALVPNAGSDDNKIRIGVRERIFKKISYFYSREFSKKVKSYDMGRLPMFRDEDNKKFLWEVIPVNTDLMDNDIEGGEVNEKCKFTM